MSTTPRVWAPRATSLDLVSPGAPDAASSPMTPSGGGWWTSDRTLPDGTDYWFSIDGAAPLPDPRSLCQPHGVHGPSRTWTADGHAFVPSPELDPLGAVFYELHVGTFTEEGTLLSAIDRLDHLVDLGVDVVELMPLAAFAGEFGWGYDGVDLYAVHPAYGGPDALVEFVDAAHTRGLAVCIDVVLNHLGPWGNYLERYAPYYSDRHQTPWGPGFDLDGPDSREAREYLLGVCRHWLVDMHADCLRLDAIHAITDDSPVHLLQELSRRTARWSAAEGRPMTLVAESDLNDITVLRTADAGGLGMDAQWDDDIHHALHAAFTGESQGYYADFAQPGVAAHVLRDVFLHAGTYSSFRGRIWGAPVPESMDRRRFVAFSQDHDQVGNRAAGDRPSTHLTDAQLAGLAAVVLLSPYTPMLFMGEEWGTRTPFAYFADQEGEERARLVREGRAREFGAHGWGPESGVPDPTAHSTVAMCTLDWDTVTQPRESALLDWYRTLITLRRTLDLGGSGTRCDATQDSGTLTLSNGPVTVQASLRAGTPLTIPAPPGTPAATWTEPDGEMVRVIVNGGARA